MQFLRSCYVDILQEHLQCVPKAEMYLRFWHCPCFPKIWCKVTSIWKAYQEILSNKLKQRSWLGMHCGNMLRLFPASEVVSYQEILSALYNVKLSFSVLSFFLPRHSSVSVHVTGLCTYLLIISMQPSRLKTRGRNWNNSVLQGKMPLLPQICHLCIVSL